MNIIHKSRVYISIKEITLGKDVFMYLIDKVTRNVIYLKEENFDKKKEYLPLQELIDKLPEFKSIQTANQKKILDVIKKELNKENSIKIMANIVETAETSLTPWKLYFKTLCKLPIDEEKVTYFQTTLENYINEYKKTNKIEIKEKKKVKGKTIKLIMNYPFLNLYTIAISASMVMLITCTYSLFAWYQNGESSKNIIESALTDVRIMESGTEIEGEQLSTLDINEEYAEGYDISSSYNHSTERADNSQYWDYIKTGIISVDFDTLIKKNNETIGWIQVNNTNINYPIVQTSDNNFYLSHSFDKSYNYSGWIFADYRSDFNDLTKVNTVVYGHSMLNKTMFGTLKNSLEASWYTNKSNQIIKISTPTTNTLWRIFSIYTIAPESYYLTHVFENKKEHQKWIDTIKERSIYNFGIDVNLNNRVLTLSSCFKTNRIVVHAVLVKSVER